MLQPTWQPQDVLVGIASPPKARPKLLAVYGLQRCSESHVPLEIRDFNAFAAQLRAVQQEDSSGYLASWVRVSESFPVDRDDQSTILVHIQSIARDSSPWSEERNRYRLVGWMMLPDDRLCRFMMRYRPLDRDGGFGCIKLFDA